jgi:phosphoglycolate phosphatase
MARVSPTLFLFDLDGTLVSTGGAGLRALSSTFHDLHGIPNVLSDVSPSGKTDPAIFREVFVRFLNRDMTSEDLATVSEAYLSRLLLETQKTHLYRNLPGVGFFLDHLISLPDVILALGTGNLEKGARIKLAPTGLNSYFTIGAFGSDAEDRAELLEIGRKRVEKERGTSILREHVYVVGDTELDVKAARRAGFNAVAVATGNRSKQELAQADPDYLLDDLTGGLTLLAEIRKKIPVSL